MLGVVLMLVDVNANVDIDVGLVDVHEFNYSTCFWCAQGVSALLHLGLCSGLAKQHPDVSQ